MKDEYLSIAEFAKRAGVTRQTVYRKLSHELQEYVTECDNVKVINIKALELFGVTESYKDVTATVTDFVTYFDNQNKTLSHLVDVLEGDLAAKNDQIAAKDHQIEAKDRQIEAKNKQIEDLTRLIDQAHVLADQSHKLNAQAHGLLAGSRQDQDPSPVDQDEIDAAYKKGKADAQKQMVRIAKALSRNYPDAADFLIAEFDKKD